MPTWVVLYINLPFFGSPQIVGARKPSNQKTRSGGVPAKNLFTPCCNSFCRRVFSFSRSSILVFWISLMRLCIWHCSLFTMGYDCQSRLRRPSKASSSADSLARFVSIDASCFWRSSSSSCRVVESWWDSPNSQYNSLPRLGRGTFPLFLSAGGTLQSLSCPGGMVVRTLEMLYRALPEGFLSERP